MMGFGFGGFGFFFMFLFLVIVIGLSVWLLSALFPRPDSGSHQSGLNQLTGQESALDILQKRYARGELSQSEYETMRQELMDAV